MGYWHTEDITLMRKAVALPTEVWLGHCGAGLSVMWDILLLSPLPVVRAGAGALGRTGFEVWFFLKTPSSALPRPGEHRWANFPLDQGLIWGHLLGRRRPLSCTQPVLPEGLSQSVWLSWGCYLLSTARCWPPGEPPDGPPDGPPYALTTELPSQEQAEAWLCHEVPRWVTVEAPQARDLAQHTARSDQSYVLRGRGTSGRMWTESWGNCLEQSVEATG